VSVTFERLAYSAATTLPQFAACDTMTLHRSGVLIH